MGCGVPPNLEPYHFCVTFNLYFLSPWLLYQVLSWATALLLFRSSLPILIEEGITVQYAHFFKIPIVLLLGHPFHHC
jgi:hypothetical protein